MGGGSSHGINITPSTQNISNMGTDPDQIISQNGIATFVAFVSPVCPKDSTTCTINNSTVKLRASDRAGTPNTLQDLINLVGASNLSYDVYVNATGTVTGHDCASIHSLKIAGGYGTGPSDVTAPVIISRSPESPNTGGPIDICSLPGNRNVAGTCWFKFYSGSLPLTYIKLSSECGGFGCGCLNQGSHNVSIILRYVISVNFLSYCSQGLNLGNDFCFNIVDAYLRKYSSPAIDTAMKKYCKTKFPNGTLDMFNIQDKPNPNDHQICPCNMPDATYDQFSQAISSKFPGANLSQLHPPCLVPACYKSNFKNNALNNCPGPKCLNIANFTGNTLGGNVSVNQSADCANFQPTPEPKPVPTPTPTPAPTPAKPGATGTDYTTYIIIGVIILVIIGIIIGIVFFIRRRNRSSTKSSTKSFNKSSIESSTDPSTT